MQGQVQPITLGFVEICHAAHVPIVPQAQYHSDAMKRLTAVLLVALWLVSCTGVSCVSSQHAASVSSATLEPTAGKQDYRVLVELFKMSM